METENKCKHEFCYCLKGADSDFCSSYCETAKDADVVEPFCGCGHPGCKANAQPQRLAS